ncbi:No apical meristem (NAM) protein [Corchorus olitorius]|uniref:No apical meristem (NAM) protein n=1 Tax=Corchorus olitorius TaxID=93759 RepID=A0A1R3KCN6_9ROSI|nr:No apical meristem (NAM) protein [Corchorus olitorius]
MEQLRFPAGVRFHPTDVEVLEYLRRKVKGKGKAKDKKLCLEIVAEVDVYKHAPWDLPHLSALKTKSDPKWYFLCPTVKKFAKGPRLNRAGDFGYWKSSGKEKTIKCNHQLLGSMKTLVFHQGKSQRQGDKTDWIIHEYRLFQRHNQKLVQNSDYVFCVVFKKHGYEEFIDDDDDDDDEIFEDDNNLLIGTSSVPAPVPLQIEESVPVPVQVQEESIEQYLKSVSELLGIEDIDGPISINDGQGGNFGLEFSEQHDINLSDQEVDWNDVLQSVTASSPVGIRQPAEAEAISNSVSEPQLYGQDNYGGTSSHFFQANNYAPSN